MRMPHIHPDCPPTAPRRACGTRSHHRCVGSLRVAGGSTLVSLQTGISLITKKSSPLGVRSGKHSPGFPALGACVQSLGIKSPSPQNQAAFSGIPRSRSVRDSRCASSHGGHTCTERTLLPRPPWNFPSFFCLVKLTVVSTWPRREASRLAGGLWRARRGPTGARGLEPLLAGEGLTLPWGVAVFALVGFE